MTEMIHFTDEDISTEYSALMSKVMTDGEGKIKFPINEPAEGKRKSQIEEYLEFNHGPGVAARRDGVVETSSTPSTRSRTAACIFLATPESYYEDVGDRVGEIDESWDDLRRLRHPRRPRRRRLPAPDLHEDRAGPADALLRGDRAPRRARLRRRQLQGAVRGDRARAGAPRQPLASSSRMSPQRRTALLSILAAGGLVLLKLGAGLASGSLGLLSEALHSGTDLVAALLTFFAVGVAGRPADRHHAYGHGKAEHLAALAEAAILALAQPRASRTEAIRRFGNPPDARPRLVGVRRARDRDRRRREPRRRSRSARRAGTDSAALALERAALRERPRRLDRSARRAPARTRGLIPEGDAVAALFVAVLVIVAAVRLMRANVDVLMDRVPDDAEDAARAAIAGLEPGVELRRLRMRAGRRPSVRRRRHRRPRRCRGRAGPRGRRRSRGGGAAGPAGQRRRRARRARGRAGGSGPRARGGARAYRGCARCTT